jgi:hypothetical protein
MKLDFADIDDESNYTDVLKSRQLYDDKGGHQVQLMADIEKFWRVWYGNIHFCGGCGYSFSYKISRVQRSEVEYAGGIDSA